MNHKQTPAQNAADIGIELAYQSNEAFDVMRQNQADEHVLKTVSKMAGVAIEDSAFERAAQDTAESEALFNSLASATGNLIGPGAIGSKEVSAKSPADILAESATLTPEQIKQSEALSEAMAERFGHIGAKKEDFKMVMTDLVGEDGYARKQFTLIYAADQGLDMSGFRQPTRPDRRRWNAIMSPRVEEEFSVEVGGEAFDTRNGATLEAVTALAEANPNIVEWVWLTGEAEDLKKADQAPILALNGGHVTGEAMHGIRQPADQITFRPAVVIA